MKITFLGTGTSVGIPVIGCDCPTCTSDDPRDNRTRTSIYIEVDGIRIVVDTGPDFRAQLLREGIDDIDVVLFTHPHKDHMGGLDDIRPINYIKEKVIDVYASRNMIPRLKQEYPYIFDGDYPGIPMINLFEHHGEPIDIRGTKVIPIRALHGKMEVFGYRIYDFTYLTDANAIEPKELDKIRGSKVFVLNAIHHKKHYSHFNLKEALEVVKEVGAETTWLIHMNHWFGPHEEVEATLPEGVHLSYDGLKINL